MRKQITIILNSFNSEEIKLEFKDIEIGGFPWQWSIDIWDPKITLQELDNIRILETKKFSFILPISLNSINIIFNKPINFFIGNDFSSIIKYTIEPNNEININHKFYKSLYLLSFQKMETIESLLKSGWIESILRIYRISDYNIQYPSEGFNDKPAKKLHTKFQTEVKLNGFIQKLIQQTTIQASQINIFKNGKENSVLNDFNFLFDTYPSQALTPKSLTANLIGKFNVKSLNSQNKLQTLAFKMSSSFQVSSNPAIFDFFCPNYLSAWMNNGKAGDQDLLTNIFRNEINILSLNLQNLSIIINDNMELRIAGEVDFSRSPKYPLGKLNIILNNYSKILEILAIKLNKQLGLNNLYNKLIDFINIVNEAKPVNGISAPDDEDTKEIININSDASFEILFLENNIKVGGKDFINLQE